MRLYPPSTGPRRFGKLAYSSLLSAAIVAIAMTGTQSDAQNKPVVRSKLWEDIGASERIDFSGRLHMLSQRIAASTCNMEAGVNPDISKGILAGSADEIDRIMNALENGNARMKIIGAETNPRIKANITRIDGQWAPIRDVITGMVKTGHSNGQDLSVFETWNIPFYNDANLLVSEIAAQYSDPADLLQGDAILVDLAGRQRMRTQQMLKQACIIWKGDASKEDLLALQESIDLFDRTLAALKNGATDVGIKPAPNEKIRGTLDGLEGEWAAAKSSLTVVASGNELPADKKSEVYMQLNTMLIQSNSVVTLYTKFAKRQY